MFLCCAAAAPAAIGATNVVVNGDFAGDFKPMWFGGPFGGGPGAITRETAADGSRYARLFKEKGPGGTQLISEPFPVPGASRVRFSMRYRTNGCLAFLRYCVKTDGKWRAAKGPDGAEASITFNRLSSPGEWMQFSHICKVPPGLVGGSLGVRLQFQAYPRADSPGFFEVADISLEPLEAEKAPEVPPVSLTAGRAPLETGYGPITGRVEDFSLERRNGLIYRDGRPFFWVGFGSDTGAGMSSPTALWLARLQGVRFISTFDETSAGIRKVDDTHYETYPVRHPGWVSWQREANRLGMMTEPHPLTKWSKAGPLGKFAAEHPEWKEVYFRLGHYLSIDTGSVLGREIMRSRHEQYVGYTWPWSDGKDYCEINREPGPENCNARMRAAFREFVHAKYSGDLKLLNATWRTDFGRWEDVRPLHLDVSELADLSHATSLRRHVQTTRPEHYYDFLRFMQIDAVMRATNEFADVKSVAPGMPVTIDVRGHQGYTDGYVALDPEQIGPHEDIFHLHYGYGPTAVAYNDSPCHIPTLLEQTAFPLFNYNYALSSMDKPLINAEDIVSRTRLPGSDGEAMAANDLAQLHRRPWKFRIEAPGEDGLAAGWNKPGFDDSSWGEITVPGAWDETSAYKGRSGVGWYRVRFKVEGRLRADFADGSRRFLLHGKGVAQRGTAWLNGVKVGEVRGWDTPYSLDVGAALKYGGENELVWRVEGTGYQNGLRFFCHVLPHDRLNSVRPFGEKQYAAMLWTYMMRGSSGVLIWNWQQDDELKPYLPGIVAPLEKAAAVALEDLRSRRSKVAYLYGFLAQRGLPASTEKRFEETMAWYDAIEFLGTRPDVVGERTFCRRVTAKTHPLLVVPESAVVEDATYEHFKEYLAQGGTAIISSNSLVKTFSRHRETDVRSLGGRLVVWPQGLGLEELMARLGGYVPAPEVKTASSQKGEPAYIERMLAGGPDAKVLYLFNWGGLDHPLDVDIPPEFRNWRIESLRGEFRRSPQSGRLGVTVPSQAPAACLLVRPGAEPPRGFGCPKFPARLLALNEKPGPDDARPRVLWARERAYFPYVLDRIDHFGFASDEVPPQEWTPEMLDRHSLVVIPETESRFYNKAFTKETLAMLEKWVAKGGSLLVMGHSAGTINAYGGVLRGVANKYGLNGEWRSPAKATRHASFGDAWQILAPVGAEAASLEPELLDGVSAVSLYTLSPMKNCARGAARENVHPVVEIPQDAEIHAGLIAMGAVRHGKGRVFVSADTMFCQPHRIGHADNAAFLHNIVGWLLRRPVSMADHAAFKRSLSLE